MANAAGDPLAGLPNVAALIETEGQITLGQLYPVGCVAIANDDHNCLAMLQRRDGETLYELLTRLDDAIARALRDGEFTDEINPQD
ncbi:MAG: hypothetical protein KJZ96_14475 [Rhodocyclaceae bacterium]|nr:hypothetical protein [Rhodocyclaceae bacterium]MCL4759540.1 hypothetical protein [Rhodocyclaceae bacterium]